jgi:hypothetical protein
MDRRSGDDFCSPLYSVRPDHRLFLPILANQLDDFCVYVPLGLWVSGMKIKVY